ncbi:MAG: nucleoside triphosphate pyrophosphohydrolase [Myxococcota bacterium]|jgi:MazG family protein|nr:nucleoside triphosphate pyrophosphohydrolase [Myxococcota bacterium]
MSDAQSTAIENLLDIMARLRDPDGGCPWDVEQTFETIAPYTLEEAYEVDHAIRTGDMVELCDELGDLLLQVVFHAQMAREAGHFDFEAVAAGIGAKLVRRHPHVFGDPEQGGEVTQFEALEDFARFWEESKAKERAGKAQARGEAKDDPFEGVPMALPALSRAVKLKKRAKRIEGLAASARETSLEDTALEAALRKALDATREGPDARERSGELIGSLLLRLVDAARELDIDPEAALRDANQAFEERCREAIES